MPEVGEREDQAMFGLEHFGGRVEAQPFGMAAEVGDGDEQVERLAVGQQPGAARGGGHRRQRIEQQAGELRPPEGRLEPARADEMGELRADLLAFAFLNAFGQFFLRAAGGHPGDRQRPGFGEARIGGGFGIEQRLDIGDVEPQVGQRVERLAGGDRLAEEDAVDTARAGTGDDIDQHPQPQPGFVLKLVEQCLIDALAAGCCVGAIVEIPAGARGVPDLLGDAVHVHRQADAAVANQGEAEFLLAHLSAGSGCHAFSTRAQIGRWSEALRADGLICTPASTTCSSRETRIRSSRATGRRAWKLGPVCAQL